MMIGELESVEVLTGMLEMPGAVLQCPAGEGARLRALAGRPLALAIGIFDGVHLGHQAVLESAIATARARRGWSAVLTFSPHPSRVLGAAEPTPLLQPESWKTRRLLELGVDAVIWKTFDTEFARLPAQGFVGWLARHLAGLSSIHVGANFRFGRGRGGDPAILVAGAREHGLDAFSIERLHCNGEPVSSSRLRLALAAGRMAEVNTLLGAPYRCGGQVLPGRQHGRTLGFPTLNIGWNPEARPAGGVYAVEVRAAGGAGTAIPGVANYGLRPTIEERGDPLLEVHLLGACPFAAGDPIIVDLLHHLRPEQRFRGNAELRAAIAADVAAARAYFRTGSPPR
jgi:riboflavin kinase/FMN adenylyltransferase